MVRPLACPFCGDKNVTFSGITVELVVRASSEFSTVYTCQNSHVFSIFEDAGRPGTRKSGVLNSPKPGSVAIPAQTPSELSESQQCSEPRGWRELQEIAQNESDPKKLGDIVDRMNSLLDEWEETEGNGDSSAMKPVNELVERAAAAREESRRVVAEYVLVRSRLYRQLQRVQANNFLANSA
jgi:hypothetical protein